MSLVKALQSLPFLICVFFLCFSSQERIQVTNFQLWLYDSKDHLARIQETLPVSVTDHAIQTTNQKRYEKLGQN